MMFLEKMSPKELNRRHREKSAEIFHTNCVKIRFQNMDFRFNLAYTNVVTLLIEQKQEFSFIRRIKLICQAISQNLMVECSRTILNGRVVPIVFFIPIYFDKFVMNTFS